MKPKHFMLTLLALLTSTSTFADVPEGNITFADNAVKAICVANWDTNSDGELSYAEAASVTDIGQVFNQNASLTSFDEFQYFTGVTSLYRAFWGCKNLASIILPNSITSFGLDALCGTSLASIHIPDGVTSIGNYAFASNPNLTSFIIPDGVTSIGFAAFVGCTNLRSINIPNRVTSIGAHAFEFCSSLTSINIPNGVTSIEEYTFNGCSSLTSINIPASVTSIAGNAFNGCIFLASSFINNSTLSSNNNWGATIIDEETADGLLIKNSAVVGCRAWATSVTIPEGVTSIGGEAFAGCSDLTSVSIPNSAASIAIGENAFRDCPLQMIHFTSTTPSETCTWPNSFLWLVPDEALSAYKAAWSNNANIIYPESALHDYISFADPAVKSILVANYDTNNDGEVSYVEAALVTSMVNFGGSTSVTSFDEFQYFTGTTTLTKDCFCDCANLESIILPNSITTIPQGAFARTNISSINIPSSLTYIGLWAFEGCSNLTNVDYPNVEKLFNVSYYNSGSNPLSIAHHFTINGEEVTNLVIPSSVLSIPDNCFSGYSCLTSVTIGDGVTSIGNEAFRGCSSLSTVTLGNGVTSIGNDAFNGCSSLTSINIPDGVTSIGYAAFRNCSSLTSPINIPNGVISIEDYTFYGCSSLPSVTLGNSVTSIGVSAFDFCSSLTSVNIPDGVTSIGTYAFSECPKLTSINVPASVTSIGQLSFGAYYMVVNMASTTPCTQGGLREKIKIVVPASAVDAYKEAWPDIANVIIGPGHIEKEITVTAKETSSAVAEEIGNDDNILHNILRLKVHGSINSYDLMVFRNKMINLLELDLSDANVVGNSYCYKEGYFSKDNVITGYFIPANITVFKLPKDITLLEDNAFNGCSQLKTITLPEGITSIPGSCFSNCSSLSEITIPESVTAIGGSAFYGCSSLTSVIIPDDVTSIGSGAFYNCGKLSYIYLPYYLQNLNGGWPYTLGYCGNLTEMHLPPCLNSIGDNVFYGCSGLKDIYAYMPDIISIGPNTFNDYQHQKLYVPEFLYNNYWYDTNWSQFASVIPTKLKPDDYKSLAIQRSDVGTNENGTSIPLQSNGDAVDVELGLQGSFTAGENLSPTDEYAQFFNHADIIVDGEGHGGSLIGQDDGSTPGNLRVNTLRVKINVKAGRWYFFCFPFDVPIANCTYPGQYAWRWYDGAERATNGSGGWKPVEGTTLNARQGYAFQTSHTGNLIVEFSNPTFGGNRPKTLVAHAAANAANASWNLVGNPYSSFYDFLAVDFDAPITVYNSNGTYSAYRPADDECHLQPFEAFFVQKPTEVDAINFNADRRESYNQGQTKKAERQKVRRRAGISPQRRLINLELFSGEEQMDKTRVVLNDEKSHAYELDCDAAKMMSGDAKAQLYSVENGVNMAINERPQAGDIRLGYTAKAAGTLSISASRMDMPMMLVDTQLGTTFDLSLGSYDFDTAAGTFDGRFLLRPSGEATAINQLAAKTGVCIGTQDGGIAIGGAEGKTVRVFNAAGAEIAANDGNGFINLRSGIYVVSVDGVSAKVRVR